MAYLLVTKDFSWVGVVDNLDLLFFAWISCVAVNIYVVGLNQIFDFEIDLINKPYLPIASGEIAKKTAGWITALAAFIGLICSAYQGFYLFLTVSSILVIGTIYSVPGIYFKGKPLAAALAIATARGLVLNLGAFGHFRQAILGYLSWPFHVIAFAAFAFGFGVVISLLKDIPDCVGDRLFGVNTLTVRIGAKSVFVLALGVLILSYVGLSLAAASDFSFRGAVFLACSHFLILSLCLIKAIGLDFNGKESVYRYYMMIWKFFYVEYILFFISSCI
jgi:homogentisate phytyltransferase/homogentisate geranylgeranyltransferase